MAKPTQSEIENELNEAGVYHETGQSRYPGMSYEEGVEAALRWVSGEADEAPMTGDD